MPAAVEGLISEGESLRRMHARSAKLLKKSIPTIQRIQSMPFVRPVQSFQGIESGRVAILANGPSAVLFDPKRWGDQHIIGMNQSWRIAPARYHCIIDIGQFRELNLRRHFPWTRVGFKHLLVGVYWEEDLQGSKYNLWKNLLFESATEIASFPKALDGGFSLNLHLHGAWMPSTTMLALQFAVYAGYEEIHIWGLDLYGYKFFNPSGWFFWRRLWRRWFRVGHLPIPVATSLVSNAQLRVAASVLRKMKPNLKIWNRNPDSKCIAFEKKP